MTTAVASTPNGQDTTSAIARMLRQHITDASANDPRSRQRTIGPSGVGTPCDRRLAYTLLDWPATNTDSDPLAAIIGKATHTWLAETFTPLSDFLVEQRVTVRGALTGNADLYYKPLGAVLDWKVVGPTAMKKYKTHGISAQYRTQIHLYGKGLANAGHDVRLVGCVFLPRTGRLADMLVVAEHYDPAIADRALARMDTIVSLVAALDVEHQPAGWDLLPATDAFCQYCDWFLPGSKDLSIGCPGATDRVVRTAQFQGIAS
jgi:hypothetical protein